MRNVEFIEALTASGKWTFTRTEAATKLGKDPAAVLRKLRSAGRIISPAKGFYVIVPEEDRTHQALPPLRYVDQLMSFHQVPYYVALLSDADRYGVAPQAPQALQVMTYPPRRRLRLLQHEIIFYSKRNLSEIPFQVRNTPTGTVKITTPEATFFDLVGFHQRVGGLEYIVELTAQLGEQFKHQRFQHAMLHFGTRVLQRAGYLLELIQLPKFPELVEQQLEMRKLIYVPLNPSLPVLKAAKAPRWKLQINDQLEPDI